MSKEGTATRAPRPTPGEDISPNSSRLRLIELKMSSLHLKHPLFSLNPQPGCCCLQSNSKFGKVAGSETDNHYKGRVSHNLVRLGRKCLQLPGALDQCFPEYPIMALWERKCLGHHGVPGLHFPECGRRQHPLPRLSGRKCLRVFSMPERCFPECRGRPLSMVLPSTCG